MPYRQDPRPAFDARIAIHGILTGVLAGLGLVLLQPGSTFDTGMGWRLFAESASEDTWAAVFLIGAVIGGAGLITSHRWLRSASIVLVATLYLGLAIMFILANPFGGGSVLAGGYALLAYYLTWRLVPWQRW